MKVKKILATSGLLALAAAAVVGCVFVINRSQKEQSIIATNFVGYDFARAILGDNTEVRMLLKPATEAHSYEPTPQDIIDITNADFFIYVGGESEEWVEDIIKDNNIDKSKTIRLMDFVKLKTEEVKEGMEEEPEEGDESEEEYDEHIWTSPLNAIRIIEAMRDRFVAKRPLEQDKYTNNAANYVGKLQTIDKKIRNIVNKAARKELIFADRFPFRYFIDEYGLDYYAAFPGCAEQTEASSATIAFLINKVKADKVPVVLKIELTNGALAENISKETGAKIMTLNAAHNISQEDFDAGKTYIDIMTDNLGVLKEALK